MRGEGAPYPAYACMEILHGASPAPVCVSHRLCVIPRRGPGPKQVFFSRTGPRRPRRTLPQPAPESGCPRRPRPLRNGRAFAPNRRGSPGPDRPGPKQVFSSRTGPRRSAGPFRTPPQRLLPARPASFAQRARLCAEPVRVPGPGPSRPCSPIFAVRRAFCHCIFFPVRFDLPCVPDRRTKNSGGKISAAFALFSIYVRTGYKTQWPNHTGRFNISHSAGQFCSLPPHGRGTGRPCMLPIFNLISVIIGCSADKYVK